MTYPLNLDKNNCENELYFYIRFVSLNLKQFFYTVTNQNINQLQKCFTMIIQTISLLNRLIKMINS